MPSPFIKLQKEQRDLILSDIQNFFEEERGETIGELAADHVLNFFITHIGPHVYNQALSDCRVLVQQRMVSMEDDIYALEQKVNTIRR